MGSEEGRDTLTGGEGLGFGDTPDRRGIFRGLGFWDTPDRRGRSYSQRASSVSPCIAGWMPFLSAYNF